MSAEDIREEILLILAKAPDLTAAEIYDACTLADTQQAVYAQINYLKRNGQIAVSDKDRVPYGYRLAKPLKELVETPAPQTPEKRETEESVVPDQFIVEVRTTHRFVWDALNRKHTISLVLKNGMWHLTARRSSPVTPEMLRDMANTIESANQ